MGKLSRRGLLVGASAVAVSAALPAAKALAVGPGPLFASGDVLYQGVTFRCVDTLTVDHIRRAKEFASRVAIPPIQDWYYIRRSIPMPGTVDDDSDC